MQCVTTVTFNVKFNEEPLPYFRASRGIRQGDPISPYLLILVANVLSLMIKRAVKDVHSKGLNGLDHVMLCLIFSLRMI